MITVMGATGQVGRQIMERLLAAGESVRALGRSVDKLADLEQQGAEVLAGNAANPLFLTEAFRGADAVYTMLPFDPYSPGYDASQDTIGEAIVQAIRSAHVPFVVSLSSIGADLPSGTGFIASLHRQEQRLHLLADTNVLILRPGYFFENFYAYLELIRHRGIIADSVVPEVHLPMIATHDIAAVAAEALHSRKEKGIVTRELRGPVDLSFAEATGCIGKRIGMRNLAYVSISEMEIIDALIGLGFANDYALLHAETNRALSEGTIRPRDPAPVSTPTSFAQFATEFARTYLEAQNHE